MTRKSGRLMLCGTGMRLGQMTLETLAALKNCERIFCVNLPRELFEEVREAFPRAEDATASFPGGRGFSEAAVSRLIFRRWAGRRDAAALFHGHPLLYSMGPALIKRCRREKRPHLVLAGLSCIDGVLGALGPGPAGRDMETLGASLAAHSAPDIISRGLKLDPGASTFILNLFKLHEDSARNGGDWRRLVAHIRRYYPSNHPVWLVECAADSSVDLSQRTTVAGLRRLAAPPNSRTTLLLPMRRT